MVDVVVAAVVEVAMVETAVIEVAVVEPALVEVAVVDVTVGTGGRCVKATGRFDSSKSGSLAACCVVSGVGAGSC